MQKIFLQKGFSLVELLVVMAILGILAFATGPVVSTLRSSWNLEMSTLKLTSALRYARQASVAGKADSAWGVNISSNKITIFAGTSFASRNVAYDRTEDLSGVNVSGLTEKIFTASTGRTSAGQVVLANSFGQKTININQLGMIYE